MSKVEKFEELACWQEARELVKAIFLQCQEGLLAKDAALKNELKRAALLSMNNIARGFGKYNRKEFVRFLDASQSTLNELKSMLYILDDLQYIGKEQCTGLHERTDKARRKVLSLMAYLENTSSRLTVE